MAINNKVTLIGNIADEAKIIEGENKKFAALRIATTDTYKDKETGEWKEKKTEWHNVIAFSPSLIEELKSFKKGTRLEITGSLSYRDFKVTDEGKEITKYEARVIAKKVEQAALTKKTKEAA